MPESLHISNLTIKNFRGIEQIEIPKLARVTLLVGKNGVGKTTVLDALRVYAARGDYPALADLLTQRNEIVRPGLNGGGIAPLDWNSLFYHRDIGREIEIAATANGAVDALRISACNPTGDAPALLCRYADGKVTIPFVAEGESGYERRPDGEDAARAAAGRPRYARDNWTPATLACESLGPQVVDNGTAAKFWDSIALSPRENHVVEALQLAFGDTIERIGVVGSEETDRHGVGRLPIVKLAGHDEPVPLRSLGDGAVRLFGISLAIANARNGLLLLDEVENGIYRQVQTALWTMILRLSVEYDVQVVAATHSYDTVKGLARVDPCRADDRFLYRINHDERGHWLTPYDSETLALLRSQQSEVR